MEPEKNNAQPPAQEAAPQQPAAEPPAPQEPAKSSAAPAQNVDVAQEAMLGKPTSSWKTITAKTSAGILFAAGASSIVIGAAGLMMGSKLNNGVIKSALKYGGGTSVVAGVIEGVAGKAIWDSADSASRTRNYLKLRDQLQQKEAGVSR